MPTDQELIKIVPSSRQLAYQATEFYAFFHFGMNTYTNREWGDGTETPQIFNPTEFVADQWVSAAQNAGMKGVILTCKHHDGFCLWPTRYTSHSVVSSPWKNGRGDVVWEVSEACRRYGMKFGIYLSPWDRNKPCYGSGKEYDDYYLAQLTELLTGYGDIFSVWLDGACGEGPNGKKQIYDWKRYYECVRKYQPDACICVCGPDIRWCGNEAGDVRKSEWSVVPARTAFAESVQERSQQTDDKEFRMRRITSDMEDLGSRRALDAEINPDTPVSDVQFPLKETEELSFITSAPATSTQDPNKRVIFQRLEEQTNVHIDWTCFVSDQFSDKKNLALAQFGNLPDGLFNAGMSDYDLLRYAKQGIIIPLENLIDKYMPNLQAVFEKYPEY